MDRLNEVGVPAGAVLDVPGILTHPVIEEHGILGLFKNIPGVGRDAPVLRTGIRIDGESPYVDRPPPALGEDTDTVLGELGLSESEIAILRADGVI